MGTYFKIETQCELDLHESAITQELDRLTRIFSTYLPDSTISKFNESKVGNWFPVEDDLVTVTEVAMNIYDDSGGAFDPSVGALIDMWGFGSGERNSIPSELSIEQGKQYIGFDSLSVRVDPPALHKAKPLSLDYSGIAKGYAVDQLAELIHVTGCPNFLIDVGGEVKVSGVNSAGSKWQIGIKSPLDERTVVGRVLLNNGAVASSGTYANRAFIEDNEYSHIIDSRTGRPVTHGLVAVTSVAESAISADAIATAMLVMGKDAALEMAERHELAVLLIEREGDEDLHTHATSKFKKMYRPY